MTWLNETREQFVARVSYVQEQLADIDTSEPAAVRQAQGMSGALVASRDATKRVLASI